jgi:hypothetical protein
MTSRRDGDEPIPATRREVPLGVLFPRRSPPGWVYWRLMRPFGLRRPLTTALALAILLAASQARATDCKLIEGGSPELAAISAEERLAWLDRRLELDGKDALIWSSLWGSAFVGVTIVQAGLWPTSRTHVDRVEKVVGMTAAGIGVVSILALPPHAIADARWWRRYRRLHAKEDVCSLLNVAEQLMTRDAADDEFGTGPLVHIGNFVLNVTAGLILGLGYNDWKAFAYSTVVGIAVGELQTATRPAESREDLDRYRRGHFSIRETSRVHWGITPMLPPKGGGLLFGLHF